MRDKDKPFVLYRKGPMNFTIVPRGMAGWVQFSAWMTVFAAATIAFAIMAESLEGRPEFWAALVFYLVATLVWSFASISWMKARAEVVDVQELLRLKRQNDRKQRGR